VHGLLELELGFDTLKGDFDSLFDAFYDEDTSRVIGEEIPVVGLDGEPYPAVVYLWTSVSFLGNRASYSPRTGFSRPMYRRLGLAVLRGDEKAEEYAKQNCLKQAFYI